MVDTPWLEADSEFEGVGAHRLNPRYDHGAALLDAGDYPWKPGPQLLSVDRRRLTAGPVTALDWSNLVHRLDCIDGSHYQPDAGPLDLTAVRAASRESVIYWKASQSVAYIDPTLRRVRSEARSLFDVRGFYHWLSSITDPEQQGRHYLGTMGLMPAGEGCMLDAEEGGITVEKCLAFMETVERALKRPCSVYTGLYVAGGTIWRDPRIRMSAYGPRPMHLAAYISATSLRSRLVQLGVAHLPLHLWQWSSNGPVAGVTGRCDMNAVYDLSLVRAAAGLAQPPPTEDKTMFAGFVSNEQERVGIDPGGWQYALIFDNEKITKLHLTTSVSNDSHIDPRFVRLSNAVLDGIPDFAGMKFPAHDGGAMSGTFTVEGVGTITAHPTA